MNLGPFRTLIAASIVAMTLSASALGQTVDPETLVPGFTVLNLKGQPQRYESFDGRITVVIFLSTRCPMSNAFNYRRNILYSDYQGRVDFLILDSNVNEPLDELRTYARDVGFNFPVFYDLDNQAANALGAHGTTETFVLDRKGVVRYRGPMEDSPNPERSRQKGLRLAIDAVLAGQPVPVAQARAIGCAIRRSHP